DLEQRLILLFDTLQFIYSFPQQIVFSLLLGDLANQVAKEVPDIVERYVENLHILLDLWTILWILWTLVFSVPTTADRARVRSFGVACHIAASFLISLVGLRALSPS